MAVSSLGQAMRLPMRSTSQREGMQNRYVIPASHAWYWREMVHAWAHASFESELWEYNVFLNEAEQKGERSSVRDAHVSGSSMVLH